jgi:hypothetical protein
MSDKTKLISLSLNLKFVRIYIKTITLLFSTILIFGCNKEEATENSDILEIVSPIENEVIEFEKYEIQWINYSKKPIDIKIVKSIPYLIDTTIANSIEKLEVNLEPESNYELRIYQSNTKSAVNFKTSKPLSKLVGSYSVSIEKSHQFEDSLDISYMDTLVISVIDEKFYSIELTNSNIYSIIKYLNYNEANQGIHYGSQCQSTLEPCTGLIVNSDRDSINLFLSQYENDINYFYSIILD